MFNFIKSETHIKNLALKGWWKLECLAKKANLLKKKKRKQAHFLIHVQLAFEIGQDP